MSTSVSIAIVTKNREHSLEKVLKKILNSLQGINIRYEIIVVESGSKLSRNVVNDIKEEYGNKNIRYVYESRQGISFARNRSIKLAKYNNVAFVDDDSIVNDNWSEEVRKVLAKYPDVAIIAGKVIPKYRSKINRPKWMSTIESPDFRWSLTYIDQGDKTKFLDLENMTISTANMILRKDIIGNNSPFDENIGNTEKIIGIFGGEDYLLGLDILRSKKKILYYPKMVCQHTIFPYKIDKQFFRWKFFDNGKVFATIDYKFFGVKNVLKKMPKIIRTLYLNIIYFIKTLIYRKSYNIKFELMISESLGYLLAALYILATVFIQKAAKLMS